MNQPGYLRPTPHLFVDTAFKSLVFSPQTGKVVQWVKIYLFRMVPLTCHLRDSPLQNIKMPNMSTSSTNDQIINE